MTQKTKSAYDRFYEALTPEQKQKFEEGYIELMRSELEIATMHGDESSIKKLKNAISQTEKKLVLLRSR